MKNDIFADIAAGGIGGRQELLYTPEPEKHAKKLSQPVLCAFEPIKTPAHISSKEELYSELAKIREYYKPFMRDLSPELPIMKKVLNIKNFRLDGKDITIPEYGGPSGYALKTYETEFEAPELSETEAAYICIGGADYYAVVYINGVCVGTHEGFFSPFEFEITRNIKSGTNSLKIELYNDEKYGDGGDKLYAATGLGWDDPYTGWHHCPSGIGLYDDVRFEIRQRVNITDVFVRPMENKAEAWIEIENADYAEKDLTFELSLYGRNFEETVFENMKISPATQRTVGMCDSFTEAALGDRIGEEMRAPALHGKNIYKLSFDIANPKIWDTETPYLYELKIKLKQNGDIKDTASVHFGMRSFTQDLDSDPKGMFYLNGKKIRLRGANTMGFEQQDVMHGDFSQLTDDILLAKLCNMNYLRITQRPVQSEVYDYCDMLGLMTQTDLPLFGCMRRTKFAEGVRQAEEMERIVRSHPCNIMVTYINEPFPNAHNQPHRHMTRPELEGFFEACDLAVHMQNPDRVIKHVDGDYDPPTSSMPDNHCYPTWYNGHGIDIGRLNKGYWLPIKPGWYCGSGEFGTEGLDFPEVMRKYYPKDWIREPFDVSRIVNSQTAPFHYFFYDTQSTMEDWCRESQEYQAFATKYMTESLRRNNLMISNAIHLFIDAWPDGWMKTIMDCERTPKPAYFAYRYALEPVHISLRTDRLTYFAGEKVNIESYVCNDTNTSGKGVCTFEVYRNGKPFMKSETECEIENCKVTYCSDICFSVEDISDRETITVKAILQIGGKAVSWNEQEIEIFADCTVPENSNVKIIKLTEGTHEIAGETVTVKKCGMLPLHFVSRNTGSKYTKEFKKNDFRLWYDKASDMITPIIETTFEAEGFTPILTSGNKDKDGSWHTELAAAYKEYGGKTYVICQVDLRQENPIAKKFLKNLKEG